MKVFYSIKKPIILAFIILLALTFAIFAILTMYGKKTIYVLMIKDPITYEKLDIDSMYRFLKDFKGDGLILYIDSPGGGLETYKIASALKNIDVPKLCYIHYYSTSGAYWLCSQADYIIAEPFSIVGSIGGIIEFVTFSRLFEKLGIDVIIIKEGEYKDIGNPFRNITEEEIEILRKKLSLLVEEFKKDIRTKRNITNESLVFSGLWFFGIESKDLGLVDYIGDFDDTKRKIASMLNTSIDNIKFVFVDFKKKESILEKISKVFISEFYNTILRKLVIYS